MSVFGIPTQPLIGLCDGSEVWMPYRFASGSALGFQCVLGVGDPFELTPLSRRRIDVLLNEDVVRGDVIHPGDVVGVLDLVLLQIDLGLGRVDCLVPDV